MAKQAKTALAKLLANVIDDVNYVESSSLSQQEIVTENQNIKKSDQSLFLQEDSQNQKTIIHSISPNKCYLWRFADRPDDELGDIDSLADSIKRVGQQEPILVRPSKEHGLYEIIFGNRRWRACQLINKEVEAIIRDVSDQDAALIQSEENSAREDISDYAKAKNYDRLLKAGVFNSESDLSKHLNISPQNLNDIFAFLRVPKEIVEVIPNFKYLSRRLIVKLASLCKKKHLLPILLNLAGEINEKKINSNNIERIVEHKAVYTEVIHSNSTKVLKLQNKQLQDMIEIKPLSNGFIHIKIHKTISNKLSLDRLANQLKQIYNLEIE